MHQEILRRVVSQHDDRPAEVCLDLVELQEPEQVVRDREEDDAEDHEVEGGVDGPLVSGQAVHRLYCQDAHVGHEDDLAGQFVPQHLVVAQQGQYDHYVRCPPQSTVKLLQDLHLLSDAEAHDVEYVCGHEEEGANHEGRHFIGH
jgi:hypothetical protein